MGTGQALRGCVGEEERGGEEGVRPRGRPHMSSCGVGPLVPLVSNSQTLVFQDFFKNADSEASCR